MKHIKEFWENNKFVILAFLIWRISLFLVERVGYLLPFKRSFPYLSEILENSSLPRIIWQLANFDGVHYLYLAQRGYAADGLHVFFPVYPIFIKLASFVIGNYIIAGLLVSNLCIFLSCLLLYKLVLPKFGKSIARWSILFLLTFPSAFFFGSLYTESIFLLFILGSFYFSGLSSGIFSFLAGGTRLVGSALVVVMGFGKKNWFLIGAGFGLLSYIIFLGAIYHRPMAFIESQVAFKNARASSLTTLVTPVQVTWRYLKIFETANPTNFDFWLAILEFISFYFGIGVLVILGMKKKLPLPWIIFSLVAILMPTFSGTFASMPRYLLVVFPIFIGLAFVNSKVIKSALIMLFVILQAILFIMFTRGYFVS